MIYLVLISIYSQFLLALAKRTTTVLPTSDDSNAQFKMILALIVAIVLIITILVIVIIILFALSGKGKKKKFEPRLPKRSKHRTSEKNDSNNLLFVAKGQSDNEKPKDIEGSGSFVFSGFSTDKPIPIEETYANAVKNTEASESGVLQPRPTDLNVKKALSTLDKDKEKGKPKSKV